MTPELRAEIIRIARDRAAAGVWYVWGGNTWEGADCSGFVQRVLHEAGVHPWASKFPFRHDDNCAAMWKTWEETDTPEAGDVALYGKPRAPSHVVLVTAVRDGVVTEVVGMSRGDSDCTSVAIAKTKGAKAVVHTGDNAHRYRPGFVGFRRPVVGSGA